MSALWGFAAGEQAAQQEQQQKELLGLGMAEGEQKLQLGGAQLKLADMKIQQQEAMIKAFKSQNFGAPGSDPVKEAQQQASTLLYMANIASKKGNPVEGANLAAKAITIEKNAAGLAAAHSKQVHQVLTDVSSMLGNVHDPQSWNQFKQTFQFLHPHEAQSPLAQKILSRPYDFDFVNSLRGAVESDKDRVLKKAAEARATRDKAMTTLTNIKIRQAEEGKKSSDHRDGHLRKVGAKDLLPAASDIKAAKDMIQQKLGTTDPALTDWAARKIAERMKILEKKGKSQTDAAAEAYQDADTAGDLAGLRAFPNQPGTTRDTAITFTPAMAKDPSQLQNNMIYTLGGKYARWDAKTEKMIPLKDQ